MSLGLGSLLGGSLLLFCGLAGYKLIPALQGRLEKMAPFNWADIGALLGGLFAARLGLNALGNYLGGLGRRSSGGGFEFPRRGTSGTTVEPPRTRTLPRPPTLELPPGNVRPIP